MSDEKVPYIKRLENQRDLLIKALRAAEDYIAALDRYENTAYKSDAAKAAKVAQTAMENAIREVKNTMGGIYA